MRPVLVCILLCCLAAPALAQQLHWQAPIMYLDGDQFDPTRGAVTYKFYTGPAVDGTVPLASTLTLVYTSQPISELFPSIALSTIGLSLGECVAITASRNGAESARSEVKCYGISQQPAELFFTK